jgi:hypothetical protein
VRHAGRAATGGAKRVKIPMKGWSWRASRSAATVGKVTVETWKTGGFTTLRPSGSVVHSSPWYPPLMSRVSSS